MPGVNDAYTQAGRRIAIDTELGPDILLLMALDGAEVLSRCFVYRIRFATRASDEKVQSLLGKPATLWLGNDVKEERRPIHGLIRRIVQSGESRNDFRSYGAEIVPALWFLDRTADCRIFQQQTVPEILGILFREHGIAAFELRLAKHDYPMLEYCVQYRESALAFVSRLMEHCGMYFSHEHHANKHVLVVTDSNHLAPPTNPTRIPVVAGARMENRFESAEISSLLSETEFRPGRWAMSDYDFTAPSKMMRKQVHTVMKVARAEQHEVFDFPGGYTDQAVGDWLAHLRMEAEEARHRQFTGTSGVTTLDPGRRMVATRRGDLSTVPLPLLLAEVRHHAADSSYFNADDVAFYRNEFVAIPLETQYRPERITPKPVVQGPQTAIVVSPSRDDPIHTDLYGRIKVHFHWDRRGDRGKGNTSCWLRVSQVAAGSDAGSISVPHAGHEVVVSFLEGDPDRPLVTGRVHNSEKLPPLALPADKHKTIIRDHGNNKIIMHGKTGQEHLSLVTTRSLNLIASRPPARALSADVSFGNDTIDTWKDGTGLDEVQAIFKALTAAKQRLPPTPVTSTTGVAVPADPSSGLNLASVSDTDAGATAVLGVDINSMTDGRLNTVSLGNNNTWAYGDYNTWVNGEVSSCYRSSQYQEVHGENTSYVLGNSFQFTLGATDSVVLGAATSLVAGLNTGITVGLNTNVLLGGAVVINKAAQYTFVAADEMNDGLSSDSTFVNYQIKSGMFFIDALNATFQAMANFNVASGATQVQISPTGFVSNSPLTLMKGQIFQIG
jgi:type VI secretion system secreted protein VgrG